MATDIVVETENPEALDRIVSQLAAAHLVEDSPGKYVRRQGGYVVRCFGNPGYLEFAINHQRYGKVIGRLPELI